MWPPLVLILSSSGESPWNAISMPESKLGAEQEEECERSAEDLREEKGRRKEWRGLEQRSGGRGKARWSL
jgi:hypothetical protein